MLKRYAVAYISFFDNILTQELVTSRCEYDALEALLESRGIEVYEDLKTVEELKMLAFDCDCMISVIEV